MGVCVLTVLTVFIISSSWILTEEHSGLSELAFSRLIRSSGGDIKTRGKEKVGRKVKKEKKGKNRGKARESNKGKKEKIIPSKKRKIQKGRKGSKSTNNQPGGRAVSETCFEQSLTIMRMWKDIVANFEKQNMRMKRQKRTGSSKFIQKDIFVPAYTNLLFAGGNNRLNLSCDGSTTSEGAVQLRNLTSNLSSCNAEVNKACNTSSWPQANMTKVSECQELTKQFKKGAESCLNETIKQGEDDTALACSCWTGQELGNTVQAIRQCRFNTEAKETATALANCRVAFSKCRKYEDAAITSMSVCHVGYTGMIKKVGENGACTIFFLFCPIYS